MSFNFIFCLLWSFKKVLKLKYLGQAWKFLRNFKVPNNRKPILRECHILLSKSFQNVYFFRSGFHPGCHPKSNGAIEKKWQPKIFVGILFFVNLLLLDIQCVSWWLLIRLFKILSPSFSSFWSITLCIHAISFLIFVFSNIAKVLQIEYSSEYVFRAMFLLIKII
jgi:hypothetical protein